MTRRGIVTGTHKEAWRIVERALCWYVFMHCPDGGVAPIIGYWRKRDANRWVDEHDHKYQLEVHRFGWNPK